MLHDLMLRMPKGVGHLIAYVCKPKSIEFADITKPVTMNTSS